jgi:hypothetical protein
MRPLTLSLKLSQRVSIDLISILAGCGVASVSTTSLGLITMASHAPDSLEALLPLTIRLQTLEAQILGVQSSYDAGPSTRRSGGGSESNLDVSRKLRGIQDGLERTGSQSDALKRLLNGCECGLQGQTRQIVLGLISPALA